MALAGSALRGNRLPDCPVDASSFQPAIPVLSPVPPPFTATLGHGAMPRPATSRPATGGGGRECVRWTIRRRKATGSGLWPSFSVTWSARLAGRSIWQPDVPTGTAVRNARGPRNPRRATLCMSSTTNQNNTAALQGRSNRLLGRTIGHARDSGKSTRFKAVACRATRFFRRAGPTTSSQTERP